MRIVAGFALVGFGSSSALLSKQIDIFSRAVAGRYPEAAGDIMRAVRTCRGLVRNPRQAHQVSQVLEEVRTDLSLFEDSTALVNALDCRLSVVGIGIEDFIGSPQGAVIAILRLTKNHDERMKMRVAAYPVADTTQIRENYELVQAEYEELTRVSLEVGFDLSSVSMPWITRSQAHAPAGVRNRFNHLHDPFMTPISNNPLQMALDRAALLENPETYQMYLGLFNEFLPILGSLNSQRLLPNFLLRELEVVERWLSRGFRNPDLCPGFIAKAVRDIESLSGASEEDDSVVLDRQAVFGRMMEAWNMHCSVPAVPRLDRRPASSMLELKLADFVTRPRLESKRLGCPERYSLSKALGLGWSVYTPEVQSVVDAANAAVLAVKTSISPLQTEPLMAELNRMVTLVETDMFAGLVESAYQLDRFGVRLLDFVALPGQSEERMQLIRAVIASWLTSPTDLPLRNRMIDLMRSASDEELERIACAWENYAALYMQFGNEAPMDEVAFGFLPFALVERASSFDDLDWVREYRYHPDQTIMATQLARLGDHQIPRELGKAVFRAVVFSRADESSEVRVHAFQILHVIVDRFYSEGQVPLVMDSFRQSLEQLETVWKDFRGLTRQRSAHFLSFWDNLRELLRRPLDQIPKLITIPSLPQ